MEKVKRKDRIDVLVDQVDRYYFRMATVQNIVRNSGEYGVRPGWVDNIASLFQTPGAKEARNLFYENTKDAETKMPGMAAALEESAIGWMAEEETFPMLLGFVIGLRVAGMSSEQTKKMARTWRLGYPQDDPQPGAIQRKRVAR